MRNFILFLVVLITVATTKVNAQQPQVADSATAMMLMQKHVSVAFPTKMPHLVLGVEPQYMYVTEANRVSLGNLYMQRMYTSDGNFIDSDYDFREGDAFRQFEGIPFQSMYTGAFLIKRDISKKDSDAKAKQMQEQKDAYAANQKQMQKAQKRANKKPMSPQAQAAIGQGVSMIFGILTGRQQQGMPMNAGSYPAQSGVLYTSGL